MLRGEVQAWPDSLTDSLTHSLTTDELRAILEHGVGPLVYARLRLPQLRTDAIHAAAHEPLRASDLAEVLGALAGRGVEALILKGTALAYDLYPAPELRPRSDTDLLIARDDLAAFAPRCWPSLRGASFQRRRARVTAGGLHACAGMSTTSLGRDECAVFDAVLRFEELRMRSIALPQLGQHARRALACRRIAYGLHPSRSPSPRQRSPDLARRYRPVTRAHVPPEHERFWQLRGAGTRLGVCTRSIEVADAWLSRTPHNLAGEWLSPEELSRDEPTAPSSTATSRRRASWPPASGRCPGGPGSNGSGQVAFPPSAFMRQQFGARHAVTCRGGFLSRREGSGAIVPESGAIALPLHVSRGCSASLFTRAQTVHSAIRPRPPSSPRDPRCGLPRSTSTRRGATGGYNDDVPVIHVDGKKRFATPSIRPRSLPTFRGRPAWRARVRALPRWRSGPQRGGVAQSADELGGGGACGRVTISKKSTPSPTLRRRWPSRTRRRHRREEGHHPDIYLAWGKVRVTIWTHKIDGLTRVLSCWAAKIDRVVAREPPLTATPSPSRHLMF